MMATRITIKGKVIKGDKVGQYFHWIVKDELNTPCEQTDLNFLNMRLKEEGISINEVEIMELSHKLWKDE